MKVLWMALLNGFSDQHTKPEPSRTSKTNVLTESAHNVRNSKKASDPKRNQRSCAKEQALLGKENQRPNQKDQSFLFGTFDVAGAKCKRPIGMGNQTEWENPQDTKRRALEVKKIQATNDDGIENGLETYQKGPVSREIPKSRPNVSQTVELDDNVSVLEDLRRQGKNANVKSKLKGSRAEELPQVRPNV